MRIRYNECDPQGVAHHSSYVQWLEMARIEMLRGGTAGGGISYRELEAAGLFLVVAHLDIRYRASARFDDQIVILARVTGGGRARIDHAYEVWIDQGDGAGRTRLLAEASTTLACVDRTGRPRPLPQWLRPESHRAP
jgi:acyl-CoA thioester hydrolase